MEKLNLGCGLDYRKGWVNVDSNKSFKADKYFDLNKIPYLFKSNEFDEILMQMVLEHLDKPIEALKEAVRISKNGAKLVVIVPHATNYANWGDLQHKHNFTEKSFISNLLREYGLEELKLIKTEFLYNNKWKRFVPFKRFLKIWLNGIYDDILFEFRINKK